MFVGTWAIVLFVAFPDAVGLIRSNWPLVILGFVGAVIGNATAVGGGIVFIPIGILVYHFAPLTALKLALGSQALGMTSGAFAWARRGAVPYRALKITIPALLAGSTISALVIPANALIIKGLFGPVSILIGVLALALLNRHGEVEEPPAGSALPLAAVAFIGGMLTGWVAVGEGEVVAAFLMFGYGMRADRSIALGVVLLAVNSLWLVLLHHLFLGGLPMDLIMFTGLGCVFGARLGPSFGSWVGPRRLKIGFAVAAIADGCLFLFQSLR